MNQILSTPKSKSSILFFKIELVLSIIILLFTLVFLVFATSLKSDTYSNILDNYSISNLYAPIKISQTEKKIPDSPFVLGTISIDKINVYYPIISDFSDNLLKTSICRFYGPLDSSIGNLCLARAQL